MLKDILKKNLEKKSKDKEDKKGDKAPFKFGNELEISVIKNNKVINTFNHI